MPTTVVVASKNIGLAESIQAMISNKSFRVYTNDDLIGVELAGSLKNVIAIAAGISDGLGFGDNAKGALLTRGIVEIARLGTAMGANSKTFLGLAGIGDLITTCISKHSRNRFVGEQIGKGMTLKAVLDDMVMVAEGVTTTQSAYALAKKYKIAVPITEQVYKVLFEEKNPLEAVNELMLRDYKHEEE
jgi:glycerol-3-phosphate dehydrogenase (NAD(P)+)